MWMKAWKTNGSKFFSINPVLASTLVCLMGWFYKLNRDNYIHSKNNLKKKNIYQTYFLLNVYVSTPVNLVVLLIP